MSSPFEYPLFEHWYKTMNWILDRCDRMPKHIRFTISGRIVLLTIEIAELIQDAIFNKERKVLLQKVNAHLQKLRLYFRLCKDRNYISFRQYEFISGQINKAGSMCGGWIKNSEQNTPHA